jgi:hypothetical protein
MVAAWTGFTGVIGRLWVIVLYFMVKLDQIYVVHVTVQQCKIGCSLAESQCSSAHFTPSEQGSRFGVVLVSGAGEDFPRPSGLRSDHQDAATRLCFLFMT